jgi:hypothetical protein
MMNRQARIAGRLLIIFITSITLLIVFSSLAFSQTSFRSITGIVLKDGRVIEGTVTQINAEKVTILTKDGQSVTCKYDDVERFLKDREAVETKQVRGERKSSLEFGLMYYYYDYSESINSNESGWLPGIYLSYDYKEPSNIYIKLYGNYADGNLTYDGATFSGTPMSFDHSMSFFKFEGDIGYTNAINEKLLLIPYTGYGYRYWRRGETENISGALFIKEQYTWSYIPVGVRVDYKMDDKWTIGANAAVHFMFGGKMTAYFSEVNSALPDVDFDLGDKPAYYFEIPVSYKYDQNWSFVGTFWYEYSEIGKSDTVYGLYEPDSKTNQYGFSLGVAYSF